MMEKTLEVLLRRVAKKPKYTVGKLYLDGKYECDTLEDKDRGLYANMTFDELKRKKVYGETAIPYGRYEIVMDVLSPKYSKKMKYVEFTGGYMPRLLGVPNFSGILLHGGNRPEDTYGCILIGQNKVVGGLVNSLATFKVLYEKLYQAYRDGKRIYITIE